jgi:hypothetical protein
MPISPSQRVKISRPAPPEGFKTIKKKVWDPPDRNTYMIDDLAKELGGVSNSLKVVSAEIAALLTANDAKEGEKVHNISQEVLSLARHLESIYCRLMSNGIMARHKETVSVFHADDIPF